MTRQDALRPAPYRRFLAPFVASRTVRGLWCALVWSFWLIYFSFIVLVLALRYSVLPRIEDYRPDIEQLISRGLGQSVSIGRIEASWDGINPDLTLLDVRVSDAEGRPALAFSRIEAILSWWSVPRTQLRLRLLSIDEPTLNLRRGADGRFSIAGIPLDQDQGDGGVSEWILAQRRIRVRGATLVWEDELRDAPALVFEDLNLALDNDGRRHRFGLTALPPEALASRIDVRGDFRGTDFERMELGSGQAFVEIEYADLAVWRQWIDYPVTLPYGRGALRAWVSFAQSAPREITADVSLRDVGLRLAQDLPALELDHLSGRIGLRLAASGFAANGRGIALATRSDGSRAAIQMEPTDFTLDWSPEADGKSVVGSATASHLDVGALVGLAEYVPLDAHSRQVLNDHAPDGQLRDLAVKWKGNADRLQTYSLQTGFDALALRAQESFPGFSGLSGQLAATENGGEVALRTQTSTLDLPRIFPVSLIAFDSLSARAAWKMDKGVLAVDLARVEFSGPEAAGSAQGTYRNTGDGPGTIDLSAALTRGDARAVWRYMPHAVGAGARQWLRSSLLAGHTSDAKLILKGNLADFPFVDKSTGQFLVTVKAEDVVLDYGTGWPRIEGIHGSLRFEGNGMTVDARRGSILGAQLSNTRAEISDFDAPISNLSVKGKADGPTSEFLSFIQQSPVAERIDHFTEDMRASGTGHLDLALAIPLDEAKLGDSKIEGAYRFTNNEVTVDAGLPPIKEVNGSVQFSGSDLRIPEINASFLGGPLKVRGGLQKDGRVLITATGSIDIAQLRKEADSPLLANLSGVTPYRGEVRINKRNADLVIESTLVGLSSTFPAPFGKSAGDGLPLRFEKKFLPGDAPLVGREKADASARDQISVSLGDILSMQLVRRKQSGGFVAERGAIAIGRPLQLPERGIALGVTAQRVDLDSWRRVLQPLDTGKPGQGGSSIPLDSVSIRAAELVLSGRQFDEVDLLATSNPTPWAIRLSSRQATGKLNWDSAGSGKLSARLERLALDHATAAASADAALTESTEKLPALDIVADDFQLGARRFGKLEVQAHNQGGIWHLSRIQTTNPYGSFSGSGQWQPVGRKSRTQLAFNIDSGDVGKLLEQLGFPGAVRSGNALLDGKISWDGAPTDLDYSSLSGEMSLKASKGQFLKLDPGAAGKLLGLISLQSLPRRITLDFRDIFSEGLAFDSMSSKLMVENGLMRTDRLQIDGPSARVVLRGEVDLKGETQRLNVNVQPELGGTAALGMALINPIAGVATLLAHKVLQNPLNHMFGFDYLVTGSWDDPKVEKLSGSDPRAIAPRLPTIPSAPGVANEPSK